MSIQTSKFDTAQHILILGGRSWIGFRIAEQLSPANCSVLCTTTSDKFIQPQEENWRYIQLKGAEAIARLIESERPDVVINLQIGIEEEDFLAHRAAAVQVEKTDAMYVYCSSALALDGYQGEELVESLPARSVSEYGIFKGRCEKDLQDRTELHSLVLRFSSIHGWGPWKDSRTVALLKRVAEGELIKVNRGVVQNRCSDVKLAETIVSLLMKRASGVAHLGTQDSSEELEFLASLAHAFGYTSDSIVEDVRRSVNLAVIPDLGMHPGGPIVESETISDLLNCHQLKSYKREHR